MPDYWLNPCNNYDYLGNNDNYLSNKVYGAGNNDNYLGKIDYYLIKPSRRLWHNGL